MLELDAAFALYRDRISAAQLDKWPEMWSVHYAGDRELGQMASDIGEKGPANAMYWQLIPFGFSVEVTDSFVVFEAQQAKDITEAWLDNTERCLYATRLSVDGNGLRTTHWVIGYQILEGGIRLYDMPKKSMYLVPKVNEVIGVLLDNRHAKNVWSFDEAVAAAIAGDPL